MTDTLELLKQNKLTAILRNIPEDSLELVFTCLKQAGIKNVEITLNSKNYKSAYTILEQKFRNDFLVGAGTVMTPEEVTIAKDLGARYIISPHLDSAVIDQTLKYNLISIPAALTPTEIVSAKRMGAHIVKLFPVMYFPPEYVQALMAPLNTIDFLVVGISKKEIRAFKNMGIQHFANGAALVPPALVMQKNEAKLVSIMKEYMQEVIG